MSIKNVAIIGAGGNLGPVIVEALEKNPTYTLTALTRKSSSSTLPSNVKTFSIDDNYPTDQLLEAFKGQDAVINLMPPIDIPLHKTIIDAAVEAGIKVYIPGEFGNDTDSEEMITQVPIFGSKRQVLDYLRTKEGSGMTWTGIVCGSFFDWGINMGFLDFDLKNKSAVIYNTGDEIWAGSILSSIGKSVDGVLSHPSETANKLVYIQSLKVNQNGILAAFEKATGQKWTVTHADAEKTRLAGLEKLGKGDFSGVKDTILGALYGGHPEAYYPGLKPLSNELLGVKELDLDDVVSKIVKGEKVE